MKKLILSILLEIVVLSFVSVKVSAQENNETLIFLLDSTLTKDANAIVRSEEVVVEINSINSVTVKNKRIVTVLNKYGKGYADSYEGYDPAIKIKNLQVKVYDANGKEIKKYKKKDFSDRSAVSAGSLFTDNRIKYIDYTPIKYPYTLEFESEIETSISAYIRSWNPVLTYGLSVHKSTFKILNHAKIPLRFNEKNFEGYPIQINKGEDEVLYSISNVSALVPEVYAPPLNTMIPKLIIALNDFSLEGITGSAKDWKTLGKWEYDNLISGRDKLSEETIKEIAQLVAEVKSKKDKAKLIYNYVQNKTRYISVQLGIGGLMPFLASDVDKWGYGDCKALTNYTKALLDTQGIQSYYTEVYAGTQKRDMDEEFASIEGNHVILNIPDGDEDIWLECTNQSIPFNFIGDFTDDRNVLVLKPEGGEIKRTKKYEPEENTLHTKATVSLGADKSMIAMIKRASRGLEYDQNYGVQFKTPKDQKLYYKENWDYINNLEIKSIKINDNKDVIEFTEDLEVSCSSFIKKAGTRLLVTPNMFSCDQINLPKYKDRQMPFELSRGFVNTDEYIINLPKGYSAGNLPEKESIETEFGKYTYELEKMDGAQIKFKRFLKIVDGSFSKEKYEEYRKFRAQIKKIDKSRIVLQLQ